MIKMNRKEMEIPVPDPNRNGLEYTCPSASWGDMTGLIPYAAADEQQLCNYGEVYPYLPGQKPDDIRELNNQ